MVNPLASQPRVRLNNGVEMPLLGLGVYDMYGREAETAVIRALEIGYRLIDTATLYENEAEVGRAVRASGLPRQELFVTTKVANPDQGFDATLRAFEASLQRLKFDYIDLYLVHWPIKGKRRATWQALEKLYEEGRVRAIGVANYLQPFLEELATYARVVPAVNQVEFSPYLYLKDLLVYCRNRGIQLQAYSPLLRGIRLKDPRLLALAARYGKTPAQLILRWDMEHGVSAIPKSSNPQRLLENTGLFDFQISADDMAFMDTFHENLRVVEDPMTML
ncbi:MAG TPA: aldo/keto reductase [Chitinophagaceae bacterium]|nr:aldo/keto reductase [Chitinophagaceae bacterium]